VTPLSCRSLERLPTSTVSNTLMTPGWRIVFSFFSAFFANVSWLLLFTSTKENMLQLLPSSYLSSQLRET
jgi:hypothetical protein